MRFQAEDKAQFTVWKEALREALAEKLGLSALERLAGELQNGRKQPCAVRLEGSEAEEGYTRLSYVMETLPEVWMPFYMLVPDGLRPEERRGAIIAIPAHGANKNTVAGVAGCPEERHKIEESPEECYGKQFVRQGYVVFCPDPPGYGERIEPIASEDRVFLGEGAKEDPLGCSCKVLAQTAEALGFSLTALEIWDLQRLLDFAQQQRCVDEKRIGCAGFSGGGQYAMWLAAMDDRISLAVVSGYLHGYLDSLLECHLCPCNYAPGLWELADISDICSLIAPRPLFVENGTEDVENGPGGIAGPAAQAARIRRAYALFGKEKNLCHVTPEGVHRWYGLCYDFVDTHFLRCQDQKG